MTADPELIARRMLLIARDFELDHRRLSSALQTALEDIPRYLAEVERFTRPDARHRV